MGFLVDGKDYYLLAKLKRIGKSGDQWIMLFQAAHVPGELWDAFEQGQETTLAVWSPPSLMGIVERFDLNVLVANQLKAVEYCEELDHDDPLRPAPETVDNLYANAE